MASVLVVGGASGIGRAVLRAFRERGDTVLLADIAQVEAAAVVGEDLPGPAELLVADMSDPAAPAAAVAAAVALGGGLDIVFYNAGVLIARPLEEWSVALWDLSLAVNLRAPFLLAQAAAPHLERSKIASIVYTSSTGALRGHAGMPAYHASKGGLNNLVRALADELSPRGVRVNTVCPGWVDTPFNDAFWHHQDDPSAAMDDLVSRIPLRRQAEAEDLVGPVLFLASTASAYVTGESLVVDGGYSAV